MYLIVTFLFALILSVSANDNIARHQQFVGWKLGDSSFSGWTASGTRTNGRATDSLAEKHSGLAYRYTLSAGGLTDDNGFTGNVFWDANPNGYTVTQIGAAAQVAYDVNLLRSEALGAIPNMTADGNVIHVSPPAALPMDITEDASGAFTQAIIDPQGPNKTVVTIDAYTNAAPGKKIVSSWKIGNVQYTLSSASAGTVADADLKPPAPRASWTFGQGTVPVDLFDLGSHQYQPRVSVTVNGVPGTFVIDTSMPSIVIFDSFARSAGVSSLDATDFSGFSGYAKYLGYGLAREIKIGNSTLHNVYVNRISDPNTRLAGLLGYDFFAGSIADVELSNGFMQLYDPAVVQPTVAPGGHAFPIDLTSRRPVIAMPFGSKTVAYPFFSTGEPFYLLLAQPLRETGAVSASDVTIGQDRSIASVAGYPGSLTVFNRQQLSYLDYTGAAGSGYCALLRNAMVGPYPYLNSPLCFVTDAFGRNGGAIGLDFLRHFDWTIDYPDEKFVLTPNKLQ